ncbi:G-protein coupled receptor 157-like isoform X2 [Liolophura sinensis]
MASAGRDLLTTEGSVVLSTAGDGLTRPGVPRGMANMTVRYSPEQCAYAGITLLMSAVSVLGCTLILYTFLRFKDLRTTSRKLLVYLSLSDCLSSVGHVLGAMAYLQVGKLTGPRDLMCQVPALLSMYADLSSFLWTGALAVYLYLCIVWNFITVANKLVWLFHVICWGAPVAVVVSALVYGVVGYNVQLVRYFGHPSWCGVDSSRTDVVQWVYLTGQGWQMGVFCLAAPLFLLTSLYIRKEIRRDREQMLGRDTVTAIQSANRTLRFVPALFVVIRVWGTIRFLLMTYDHAHRHSTVGMAFLILQALGDNSQGFVNALLFCVCTKRVRRRLNRVFYCSRRCPCRRKKIKFPEFQASFQKRFDEELSSCSEIVNINTSETSPILT